MTLKIYPSTYIHRESLFLKYVFKKIFIFFIQPLKQDLIHRENLFLKYHSENSFNFFIAKSIEYFIALAEQP